MKTVKLIAPAIALALAALAGCSSGGADAGSYVQAGKLTVCTNPPYAPFEINQGDDVVGFDLALAGEVAKDLELELAAVNTGFDLIESGTALEAKTCDLLASGITITEDRKAKIDFSNPYFVVDLGVLTSDSSVTSEADLAGKVVAVQDQTTGMFYAEENGIDFAQYRDLGLQVAAVKSGERAAALGDLAVLEPFATDGLTIAFTIPIGDQLGLGVKKGNQALLDQVNKTLDRITQDGTYQTLAETWFGTPLDPPAN